MDRGGSRKARSRSRRPNGGDAPAAGAAGGGARPPELPVVVLVLLPPELRVLSVVALLRPELVQMLVLQPVLMTPVHGGQGHPLAAPSQILLLPAQSDVSVRVREAMRRSQRMQMESEDVYLGMDPKITPIEASPTFLDHIEPRTGTQMLYPPGGFMNYLQSPNFSPFAQPHQFGNYPNGMHPSGTPSTSGSTAADASKGSEEKETIDVDDDDATPIRSDKRLNWSHEEDIRLVSAWLHNSIDSVDGNDKKGDQYWSDVTATYNSTTERNRQRNRNQLKLRWERIKKPVNEFNGCYTTITKVHESGMSDDQQMDKALELYASEHSDKPFTMVHIWKILRHERKWSSYVKRKSKEKEKSATLNPAPVVNVDNTPKERPVGRNKAKDERNGKRKAPETISVIDQKLDRFIEASTKAREEREKVAEVQQNLANKKVEAARLNHKAAQEQTKCKMLELYKDLLFASTSDLSTEALAERTKALETMRLAMCPKDD
ncbi:hypothetical protein ACP70R_014769 [Stipagrostis hirtigluma subsp. patula]